MRITVPGFSGLNKLVAPQRLEDHQATVAVDCDFRSGDLRPYYGDNATGKTLGATTSLGTLFQFDETHLIAAAGKDFSFARSPTFYAESVTSDPRAIVTEAVVDPAPTPPPKWVSAADLDAAGTGLYSVNANLKRVGVPRPARLSAPTYEPQGGDITSYFIGTNINASISIPVAVASAAKLASGDKLYVDAPGFDAAAYTASSVLPQGGEFAEVTDISFRSSKRSWKTVQILVTKNSNSLKIKLPGHGFSDGDQLLFSHVRYGSRNLPNSNMPGTQNEDDVAVAMNYVWRVVDATYDNFQLEYFNAGAWTLWVRDATWTGDDGVQYRQNKKVALLARNTNPFPDDAMPTVTLTAGTDNVFHGSVNYTVDSAKVTATWANAGTADVVTTRAYFATFVNAYGDESAPSDATDPFDVAPKDTVTFPADTLPTTSFDETNYPVAAFLPISAVRLYRTDATGQFRFLKEIAVADLDTDFVDDATDAELGELISTTDWLPPPDKLQGVINAPSGTVVGFQGRTVCPSVPYAPYAYPLAYRTACDYDIVGLVATAAGVAVLTQGLPYLLTGTDPASWAMVKLEAPQACVARRSIVDMGDYGMYASPDGLVAIQGAGVEVVTKPILTREQWQAYNPGTIIAAQSEGRYIATYVPPGGGARKGFIYDPTTQSFTDLTLSAVAMYTDLLTDTLLVLNSDGAVVEWNRDTAGYKPYRWMSKLFYMPRATNFAAYQVVLADYDAQATTLQIYVTDARLPLFKDGGGAPAPVAIIDPEPKRLPGGFLAREYMIELVGTGHVQAVGMASTIDELKEQP